MTEPAYIDTETRSRNPISWGTDKYFSCPEAACFIVTWVPPSGTESGIWDLFDEPRMPPALEYIIRDDSIPLIAHNAVHDRTALDRCLKIHVKMERFRCTRGQAYAHGFPGALETLCILAGLPPDEAKLKTGHQLIMTFCVPNAAGGWNTPYTHPVEWAAFCQYAKRDTTALRHVHRWLPTHNYQGTNVEYYGLDQRINERGFGFDAEFAAAAVALLEKAKTRSDAVVQEKTGGAVKAATQRAKLLAYLNTKYAAQLENLRAATIREVLEADDLNPEVRFLLETRLDAAKSSGSKYRKGLTVKGRGDSIRHAHQFNGAGRTGRTSHKGYQPGNQARPEKWVKPKIVEDVLIPAIKCGRALDPEFQLAYGAPNLTCANALRGAIIARPGNVITEADWSNIEGRVLPWIAGAEVELAQFRAVDRGEGIDAYKVLFAAFFGGRPEDVDDKERQVGKVCKLSFNYLGGVGALASMAGNYDMDLDILPPIVLPKAKPEHLKKADKAWRRAFLKAEDYGLERDVYMACDVLKHAYREANKEIKDAGYGLGRAVMDAMKKPGGPAISIVKCLVWYTGRMLIIQLPSGRRLLYINPHLHHEKDVDPESGKETNREYLSYLTARGKNWIRERAWAGLFIENVVQAIANDILRDASRAVHADTLTIPEIVAYLATLPEYERTAISMHVHDSIALDLPPGLYELARLIHVMLNASPWAKGLPLAASGWVGFRNRKG